MRWQLSAPVFLLSTILNPGRMMGVEAVTSEEVSVETTARESQDEEEKKWWQQAAMLGDLNGARTRWRDAGWNLSLFYNSFIGIKGDGGKEPGNLGKHSGSIDFFLQTDFEKMGFIPGGEVLMQVKSNHGKNLNPAVGAISDPIDDADFTEAVYIDQLWYQQSFAGRQMQLRFGYLDLQTIIDRNTYANSEDVQFMTTFLDNNNAIVTLKIGLGATLFVYPAPWLAFIAGVVDAENEILHAGWGTAFDGFDGLMTFVEAGLKPGFSSTRGNLTGNYRIGVLWDPREKTIFKTGERRSEGRDTGVYVSFDQMLVPEEPNSPQGLGAFFRWGHRTQAVNRLSDFWSGGIQYRGLFNSRDQDLLGAGFYSVNVSGDYREFVNPLFDRETGYEVFYSFQLTPWMTVTPDFQYISDPGATPAVEEAVVFVLRTRFTF